MTSLASPAFMRAVSRNVSKRRMLHSTLKSTQGTSVRSFSVWIPASTCRKQPSSSITLNSNQQQQQRCWYHQTHPNPKDSYPPHTLYPMPALSPTMEQGTIASWTKAQGESFSAGDVLCSIETDKATIDFEAQDDGIIAKILLEGDQARDVPVGVPICVVVEEEEDVQAFREFVVEAEVEAESPAVTSEAAPTSPTPAPPSAPAATGTSMPERDVPPEFALLPSARHWAARNNIDATYLQGTGKGGRVTKGDVLQALASGVQLPPLNTATTTSTTTTPPPAATVATESTPAATTTPTPTPIEITIPTPSETIPYTDIPNNNIRKVIARRLTESKHQVPHFYTSTSIPLDNLLQLRKQLLQKLDVKVSVNDFVLKACAMALRDVPEVNASWNATKNSIQTNSKRDVSVAVATPTGLITPIVPSASELGLAEISAKVRELATKARENKLTPEEYQGGTFTVSNLGMFGVSEFSAVINPPQSSILAVGGGVRRLVPQPFCEEEEEGSSSSNKRGPVVETRMTARLSSDRRVVDEPTAALFMQVLGYYLTKPESLLL